MHANRHFNQIVDAWFRPIQTNNVGTLLSEFTVDQDSIDLSEAGLAVETLPYWVLADEAITLKRLPFVVALPDLVVSENVPKEYRLPLLLHKVSEVGSRFRAGMGLCNPADVATAVSLERDFVEQRFNRLAQRSYFDFRAKELLRRIWLVRTILQLSPPDNLLDAYVAEKGADLTRKAMIGDYNWARFSLLQIRRSRELIV